jgi:hypothetical protein
MITLELTDEEREAMRDFLERYYHDLRIEIANTDDREFRRSLKQREAVMKALIDRLKQ